MHSYLTALKNYTNFDDRTRRRDFWLFVVINNLLFVALLLVDSKLGLDFKHFDIGYLSGTYTLATTIPLLALCVRRLHDTGKGGWLILLLLIPVLNLYPFFWFFRDSVRTPNVWGASPK